MAGISPVNTQEKSGYEASSQTKNSIPLNQNDKSNKANLRSVLCYLLVIDEYS